MADGTRVHPVPGENEGTRISILSERKLRPMALGPREAFIAAYDRLSGLAGIARQPAMIAAAVDGRARVVEAVLVEAGDALIIGRHSECGLRLPAGTISLRHLAAHARVEDSGSLPVTRLWDLNTEQPFTTEDGQPNAAVIAQGTLYAAVSEYALLFVPTRGPGGPPWPDRAEEAWRALPPRQFIDRRTPSAALRAHPRRLRSDGQEWQTQITRVGPLMLLGEGETPESAWGELRLVKGPEETKHRISAERLEQGVLVGRYDRCGIHLSGIDRISRVHLLVIRMGEEVLAIDTASTNGTFRGSTRIETALLGDPDALSLAESVEVHWHRIESDAVD